MDGESDYRFVYRRFRCFRFKFVLIALVCAFLIGYITANRVIEYDPSTPYVFGIGMFLVLVVVLYPYRFRKWVRQVVNWYAFDIRYEMHCRRMREAGEEPIEYEYWKHHYIMGEPDGPGYTVWRVLTGYQGLRFWKWAMFDMEAVGRFSRFLMDWWAEERKQRHEPA